MSWTRLCSVSGPRKIVRPANNLRTNVQLLWIRLVPRSLRPPKLLPLVTEPTVRRAAPTTASHCRLADSSAKGWKYGHPTANMSSSFNRSFAQVSEIALLRDANKNAAFLRPVAVPSY